MNHMQMNMYHMVVKSIPRAVKDFLRAVPGAMPKEQNLTFLLPRQIPTITILDKVIDQLLFLHFFSFKVIPCYLLGNTGQPQK